MPLITKIREFLLLRFFGLTHILQVCCPIWVFVVAFSEVPLFRSFGADQCASSEGFLVTFTPRTVWRIRIFPLNFLSEYFSYVHNKNTVIELLAAAGVSKPSSIPATVSSLKEEKVRGVEEPVSGHDRRQPRWLTFCCVIGIVPGGVLRIDLMNPKPILGILVASNPTDEGRIGTGRNTKKSSTKELLPSLICIPNGGVV